MNWKQEILLCSLKFLILKILNRFDMPNNNFVQNEDISDEPEVVSDSISNEKERLDIDIKPTKTEKKEKVEFKEKIEKKRKK